MDVESATERLTKGRDYGMQQRIHRGVRDAAQEVTGSQFSWALWSGQKVKGSQDQDLPGSLVAPEAAGGAPLEISTLRRLAGDLPDDNSKFHGVHWTRLDQGYSVFRESDFIVLGGQVILIEWKSFP